MSANFNPISFRVKNMFPRSQPIEYQIENSLAVFNILVALMPHSKLHQVKNRFSSKMLTRYAWWPKLPRSDIHNVCTHVTTVITVILRYTSSTNIILYIIYFNLHIGQMLTIACLPQRRSLSLLPIICMQL